MIGLIKVLLQLEHRTLLPSITSSEPNPQIPFAETPFAVQRTLAPWERLDGASSGAFPPRSRAAPGSARSASAARTRTSSSRRLQTAQAPLEPARRPSRPRAGAVGAQPDALVRYAGSLADVLEQHPSTSIADVAFTINGGRKHVRASRCRRRRRIPRRRFASFARWLAATRHPVSWPAPADRRRTPPRSRFSSPARARSTPGWAESCTRRSRCSATRSIARAAIFDADARSAAAGSPVRRRRQCRGRPPQPDRLHAAGALRVRVRARAAVALLGNRAAHRDGPQRRRDCRDVRGRRRCRSKTGSS